MMKPSEYLANAVKDDPDGATCVWCRGPNLFCDDIGFIHCAPYGENGPHGATCESCYRGGIDNLHIARYGLGDR